MPNPNNNIPRNNQELDEWALDVQSYSINIEPRVVDNGDGIITQENIDGSILTWNNISDDFITVNNTVAWDPNINSISVGSNTDWVDYVYTEPTLVDKYKRKNLKICGLVKFMESLNV